MFSMEVTPIVSGSFLAVVLLTNINKKGLCSRWKVIWFLLRALQLMEEVNKIRLMWLNFLCGFNFDLSSGFDMKDGIFLSSIMQRPCSLY